MLCSQKVGQKKWSHNSSQRISRNFYPYTSSTKRFIDLKTQMVFDARLDEDEGMERCGYAGQEGCDLLLEALGDVVQDSEVETRGFIHKGVKIN